VLANPPLRDVELLIALPLKGVSTTTSLLAGTLMVLSSLKGLLDVPPLLIGGGLTESLFLGVLTTP
jgi:hypothetical protein